MSDKKGLSPIISTTLLVALAVAVGVSIVTYAGVLFEKKSLDRLCNNYVIDFFELDNTKNVCISQFELPLALKFKHDTKPTKETDCYISIASGTSRICNTKEFSINNTWVPSKNIKI
jgi:hypothetical protein